MKLPVAAATTGYVDWSTPIVFSGVPCWVCRCTLPGRLTTPSAKLALFTRYVARASTSQYRWLPTTAWSTPSGRVCAWSGSTRNTDLRCGASSRALAWIAAGLQA